VNCELIEATGVYDRIRRPIRARQAAWEGVGGGRGGMERINFVLGLELMVMLAEHGGSTTPPCRVGWLVVALQCRVRVCERKKPGYKFGEKNKNKQESVHRRCDALQIFIFALVFF
jgi:hypothetical protein